jgi:glycosyltransferase 2 family protein
MGGDRLTGVLRATALLVLVAALALSVRSQWSGVREDLANVSVLSGGAALVLSVLAVGVSCLAWRTMLADLGSRLPVTTAAHVFSVSQLGKYLPGSVWPIVAQMELGRGFHVPRLRMLTAFFLTLLSSVVVAVAMGGLLALSTPGWGRALAVLPVVLGLMHPRVLDPLARLLARVLRRTAVTEPPSLAGVIRTAAWIVAQWVLLGAATTVLAHALGAPVSPARLTGAVALSWAAGLVVVVVPAGVGVREGALTLILAPTIGTPTALALALLGRLALTVADALFAVVGLVLTRRARAHAAGAGRPVTVAGVDDPRPRPGG